MVTPPVQKIKNQRMNDINEYVGRGVKKYRENLTDTRYEKKNMIS